MMPFLVVSGSHHCARIRRNRGAWLRSFVAFSTALLLAVALAAFLAVCFFGGMN